MEIARELILQRTKHPKDLFQLRDQAIGSSTPYAGRESCLASNHKEHQPSAGACFHLERQPKALGDSDQLK